MAAIYFTITGTNFRYGQEFFEKDMIVGLVKEPDNGHDREAIKVERDSILNRAFRLLEVHYCQGMGRSQGNEGEKADDSYT